MSESQPTLYEYTVVKLPDKTKTSDLERTDLLNRVAAHGWRLVSVSTDPGMYGTGAYAYFERRVGQ